MDFLNKAPKIGFAKPWVVEARVRDAEAGWLRSTAQAPASAESRLGSRRSKCHDEVRSENLGVVELPADADRMDISADTPPRKT